MVILKIFIRKTKKIPAQRLLRWALSEQCGKYIVKSGPIFKSAKKNKNKLLIEFEIYNNPIKVKDNKKLKWSEIASDNQKFIKANAGINSDSTILLWNDKIKNPLFARYCWHQEAVGNLTNLDNLPVSPFNTAILDSLGRSENK